MPALLFCNVLNRTDVFLTGQVETMPGAGPECGQEQAKGGVRSFED